MASLLTLPTDLLRAILDNLNEDPQDQESLRNAVNHRPTFLMLPSDVFVSILNMLNPQDRESLRVAVNHRPQLVDLPTNILNTIMMNGLLPSEMRSVISALTNEPVTAGPNALPNIPMVEYIESVAKKIERSNQLNLQWPYVSYRRSYIENNATMVGTKRVRGNRKTTFNHYYHRPSPKSMYVAISNFEFENDTLISAKSFSFICENGVCSPQLQSTDNDVAFTLDQIIIHAAIIWHYSMNPDMWFVPQNQLQSCIDVKAALKEVSKAVIKIQFPHT